MTNQSFFINKGPFSLNHLANSIKATSYLNGKKIDIIDPKIMVSNICTLEKASSNELSFFTNAKYAEQYIKSQPLACITSEKFLSKAPKDVFILITSNPYADFARIMTLFYPNPPIKPGISKDAHIHPTATIGENCEIAHNVTIGAEVKIEANTKIYPGVYINDKVQIGNNCIIHHDVTLDNCFIGNNTIIHPGTRVGQDGFGYAFDNYQHIKVPQIGRVIIGSNVEIGANCTIDRGAIDDTIIGDMCKIDNLVQIGHNVVLGTGCIIVSQVGISGSTELGKYVMLGGQAGLSGHIKIGDGAQIAAQSGVMQDIEAKQIVGGSPSLPIRQWHKQTAILKKLSSREQND
jgi:UDP-3-O-[3-hydroxymyristoyl] glucosamine N-acyltransferase